MPVQVPSDQIVIGYWQIRGLAAPLRMMCSYAGVPFTDQSYPVTTKPDGSWDLSAWFVEDKPGLLAVNPLINLPYIVDGPIVVTQSNACLTYLGRKLRLLGEGEVELVRAEQAMCQVFDLRNEVVKLAYGPKETYEAGCGGHFERTLPTHYVKFEGTLKTQGTKFLARDSPTAPDFHLWEMIDQNEIWAKQLGRKSPVEDYPSLKTLYESLRADPKLAGYFAGPAAALPVNNIMANFK